MKRTVLHALVLGVGIYSAKAQLTLSNWNITQNSLSFDISGFFSTSQTPSGGNLGLLWLADVGNNSWINTDDNPDYLISGTIDGHNANAVQLVFSFTGTSAGNIGAYLNFHFDEEIPGTDFNFTDLLNNEVNLHLELTSPGKYNPGNINPADLELYWGGDAFAVNTSSAVPMGLQIPEPSSSVLFLTGLGLAGMMIRRRQKG